MLIPFHTILQKYNIAPAGVLHIGAHTGEEANDYYSNGVEKTIWVEANPNLIPELTTNLSKYHNCKIFNECLTDKDGEELVLNISNCTAQSSSILELGTHLQAHPEVQYVDMVAVITKRLDTLLEQNSIDIEEYKFVNIDVQGAELMVLKGFGDLLNKVNYLYLEVNLEHLYKDCPLLQDIEEYLKPFGFLRRQLEMTSWKWGDALFLKDNI